MLALHQEDSMTQEQAAKIRALAGQVTLDRVYEHAAMCDFHVAAVRDHPSAVDLRDIHDRALERYEQSRKDFLAYLDSLTEKA